MQIDRKQMKAAAKAAMREHRPSVYLVALVLMLILYVLQGLSMRLTMPNIDANQLMYMSDEELIRTVTEYDPGFFASILNLAITVITAMLDVGFMSFCLNVIRGLAAGYNDLFDAFGNFLRFLWLNILIGLFTFLWSLLFVIPGIIAAYRYSQAVYILLDDPDKSAMQCIRESREMTRGYKGQLFLLDLSFLGWILLSAIPFVGVYTTPYIGLTRANYYRALSGRWDAPRHVDVYIGP